LGQFSEENILFISNKNNLAIVASDNHVLLSQYFKSF